MDKQLVFKFQVISLGKSLQQFGDSHQYINRPFIQVDDLRKKWGDEYIVINSPSGELFEVGKNYLGNICLDKKCKKFLKLFREIDFPIETPDYYIINVNTIGSKIDKVLDFCKADKDSFSCILSSAYNTMQTGQTENDMIIICKDGDGIVINGEMNVFDSILQEFVPS